MTKDTGPAATVPVDREVTVHNRLSAGHPFRIPLEKALRSSLRELSGRWEVSLHEVGRILLHVDVVAPDGWRWSLAVPRPQGPGPEDIAEAVRAGCARLCRIRPALAEQDREPTPTGRQGPGGNQA